LTYSYISHVYCPKCRETYHHQTIQHVCHCGSPLLVSYDLLALKNGVDRSQLLKRRHPSLWRFHELLPVIKKDHIISLGEGMTPLIEMSSVSETLNIANVYMKDEGMLPTGTFKARGAAVGISKANELGVTHIAMPTNGNAGAAWTQYAARAHMSATIVMPKDAPMVTRHECSLAGADVYVVDGLISDAGQIVQQAIKDYHLYDASTLKEPYRIEGKKTMGLEIVEQLGWEVPDVIIYPTGGGVGLIGIFKALKELQTLGWIDAHKMPRLVAVQAEGCAPIVEAWKKGKREATFWENAETIAFGINVPKALGDFLILDALYDTSGCAISVADEEIMYAQSFVAKEEGAFICPEGASAFAAMRKLKDSEWIKPEENVVILNTGIGLKYSNIETNDVTMLENEEKIELPVKS